MSQPTFVPADVTTFARVDELGLRVTGQRVQAGRAVLACRVVERDDWCRRCGCQGILRESVIRQLAHIPMGWCPTTLQVRVRRYRCHECGNVWRQDTSTAAEPRAKISRGALVWALQAIAVGHMSMARVAVGLGVSWNTANTAILAEGKRVLFENEHRFDGVAVIGVDDAPARCASCGGTPSVWRHTRKGDTYATVIIDLTPVRDGTGPARLLDMVEDRHTSCGFQTSLLLIADVSTLLGELHISGGLKIEGQERRDNHWPNPASPGHSSRVETYSPNPQRMIQ